MLKDRKVTVALVDDDTIAELHERFLNKPGPTDVLSFPHGEIVVSGDTARREAERRGIRPLHELLLYVVHGALHLLGYKDGTQQEREQMRAREREVLSRFGLDPRYEDRQGPAEAIRSDQLRLSGWIASQLDPDYRYLDETLGFLSRQLNAPLIGHLPYQMRPSARDLAAAIRTGLLCRCL